MTQLEEEKTGQCSGSNSSSSGYKIMKFHQILACVSWSAGETNPANCKDVEPTMGPWGATTPAKKLYVCEASIVSFTN